MILVIDNYDSFTWNLVHYLMELGAQVNVVRNDAISAADALASGAKGFLLSRPLHPQRSGRQPRSCRRRRRRACRCSACAWGTSPSASISAAKWCVAS
jgi:anthranilate/para-aminobenzoate synthase component II